MSTNPWEPAAARQHVQHLDLWSWAAVLVGLSVFGPWMAVQTGVGTPSTAGAMAGRSLLALAVLAPLCWLLTRRASGTIRAQAMLAAGAVLCAAMAWQMVALARHQFGLQALVERSEAARQRHQKATQAFLAEWALEHGRLEQDLAKLAEPDFRSRMTAAIQRRQAAMAQSRSILADYQSAQQALLPLAEGAGARRVLSQPQGRERQVLVGSHDAIERLLQGEAQVLEDLGKWAQTHAGRFQVKGDDIVMTSASQRQALDAIQARQLSLMRSSQAALAQLQQAQRQREAHRARVQDMIANAMPD